MNYLWEIELEAKKTGIKRKNIRFFHTTNSSPYMEVSLEILNQEDIHGINKIPVNTYFRFYSIFKDMFRPEYREYTALRESLTNLILHMIASNDARKGMTREEYNKKMLLKDIQANCFGVELKKQFYLFERTQQETLLSGWLRSYRAGSSLTSFTDMVHAVIDDSIVYHGKDMPDEILIYTSLKNTSESEQKLSLLADIFLPVHYQVIVFYEYHFGIIGIDDTMIMDEIAMY